jgi:hypothetical protein
MGKTKSMHKKTRKCTTSTKWVKNKCKCSGKHKRNHTMRRKPKHRKQTAQRGGENLQNKQLQQNLLTKEAIAAERSKTLSIDNVNIKPLKDGIDSVYNATAQAATEIRDKGVSTISNGVTTGISAGLESAGVNIADHEKTQEQINGFYNLVTSDENKEKFIEIGKDIGKIGIAVGSELIPLVEPLIDEAISIAEKGSEKAINSAINTGKFGMTSALGPLAGVPLAVMSAVDAGVSIADTGSKLATTISDTTSAAINVSNKILDEQEKTINRISKTADTFFEPPKINIPNPPTTTQLMPDVKQNGTQRLNDQGGGSKKTRSCLKHSEKNKTMKRVKFNRILEFEGGL